MADVKFSIKRAVDGCFLTPVTVSEELEQKFVKKAKSSSIKLIPISFAVSAIVLIILFLLIYFLRIFAISLAGLFCVIYPIYAIYNAAAATPVGPLPEVNPNSEAFLIIAIAFD